MVTTYTTNGSVWNTFLNDPFFIGFDKMVNNWQTVNTTNYPPYNVIKEDEDTFIVELALAGFRREDIEITTHDGKLIVKGELKAEDDDSKFIHRGIAARKFTREWALAEYMEVASAEMKDGMLKITIDRIVPEEKKPRQIKVK